jgi:hypothetical protein
MAKRRIRWITLIVLALLAASSLGGYLWTKVSGQHYFRWRSTSYWRGQVRQWLANTRSGSPTPWAAPWPDRMLDSFGTPRGIFRPAVLEGGPEAVPVLLDLLGDNDQSVRATVYEVLAHTQGWPTSKVAVPAYDAGVFRLWPNQAASFLITAETHPSLPLSWGRTEPSLPPSWGHTEHLYLLDNGGRLLDTVDVSQWSTEHNFQATFCDDPEADGAQVVVRYSLGPGPSTAPGSTIYISHGDDIASFCWGGDSPHSIEPAVWHQKGLCRLAIQDGKFRVLFPVTKPR